MKLEASGWPEQCKTDEEKQQFLDECLLQDGIELDRSELDKGLNPALTQLLNLVVSIIVLIVTTPK